MSGVVFKKKFVLITFAFVMLLGFGFATSLTDGLVFDANLNISSGTAAYDSTANPLAGSFMGTGQSWVKGFDGNGLSLTGLGAIDFNYLPKVSGLGALTLSVWEKTTDTAAVKIPISKTTGGDNGEYFIKQYNSSDIDFGVITAGDNLKHYLTCSSQIVNLSDGAWHQLTTSYDGNVMKIYVDGNMLPNCQSTIAQGGLRSYAAKLFVGGFDNSGAIGYAYIGSIDEAKIWNRALSSGEVQQLYNQSVHKPDINSYSIVVIPDSQYEVSNNTGMWNNEINWITNHIQDYNIKAVLHVGDLTDSGNITDFNNARAGYDLLDATGVPYGIAIGNHDYDSTNPISRQSSAFNTYFGSGRYTGKTWYGDNNGGSENSYIYFTVGTHKYLAMFLEFFPRTSVLDWAQSIVNLNKDKEIILVTHAWLNCDGNMALADISYGPNYYGWTQNNDLVMNAAGNSIPKVWNYFAKKNKNIILAFSGHFLCSDEAELASTGDNGNTVNQIFTDYQGRNQGNGVITIVTFNPNANTVQFTRYSVSDNQFDPERDTVTMTYYPETTPGGIPPVTTPSGNTYSNWINSNQTITLTCVDNSGADCYEVNYMIDNNGTWIKTIGTRATFTLTTDGNHPITYYAKDVNGNTEEQKTTYAAIDQAAPTTTPSGNSAATSYGPQTITLTCIDPNSGCLSTNYRINSGSWQNYSSPIVISSDGNYRIDYNSTDNLGHVEDTKTIYVDVNLTQKKIYFPYGGVVVMHSDCSETDYPSASDTNAARGAALMNAVNADANGDVLYLSKGTFDIDNNTINLSIDGTKSVSMHGAGMNSTFITSGNTTANSQVIKVGVDGCQITDLTVNQTDPNPTNHSPIGWADVGNGISKTIRGLWIKNIKINAKSNGLLFNQNGSNGVLELTVINLNTNTNYDSIAIREANLSNSSTVRVYDSNLYSDGANWDNPLDEATSPLEVSGTDLANVSDFKAWNSTFTGKNARYIYSDDVAGGGEGFSDDSGISTGLRSDKNSTVYLYDSNFFGIPYPDMAVWGQVNPNNTFGYADIFEGDGWGGDGGHVYISPSVRYIDANGSIFPTLEVSKAVPSLPNNTCIAINITSSIITTSNDSNPLWNARRTLVFDCNSVGAVCKDLNYSLNGGLWVDVNYPAPDYNSYSLTLPYDGNIFIQYKSTDSSGNTDTTQTAYHAVDTTTPTFSRVDNNSAVAWRAADFNVIIVDANFYASDINTAASYYTLNGGAHNAFSTTSEGAYDYNLYIPITSDGNYAVAAVLYDNAGNSTTINTWAMHDKTAPSVGSTALSGFSTYSTFINGTGTIVGGTATDGTGSGIDTTTCQYTVNNGGAWSTGTWSSNHCQETSVSISNGGAYQFNTRVKDAATNQGTGTATTAYTGDAAAPTTSQTGCGAAWNNTNQTITLSCDDGGGSGCANTQYSVNSGEWNTGASILLSTDGNHKVDYNSTDNLGNIEGTKTTYCTVDKTAPTITASVSNPTWHTTSDTITLSCSDSNSGCKSWRYKIDGGSYQTYSTPFTISTDGNHSITFDGNDNANNQSNSQTIYSAIDKTPPSTTPSGNNSNWNSTNQTITFSCSDSNSLCASTAYYDHNDTTWHTGNTYTISTDGNHQIDYNSTDNAGNTEITKTIYVAVDKTAPATTPTGNTYAAWTNSSQVITLTCSDSNSGCHDVNYMIDNNGTWIDTAATSATLTLTTDGNHPITYYSVDNVSNREAQKTTYAAIDKTPPVTTSDANSIAWQNFGANIHLTCTDANSGCDAAKIKYRLDSDANSDVSFGGWNVFDGNILVSTDGNYAIDFNSTDAAGNAETTNRGYALVDKTIPTILSNGLDDGNLHSADFNVWFYDVNFEVSGKQSAKYFLGGTGPFDFNYSQGDTNFAVAITTDGNYLIKAWFRDTAGNDLNVSGYAALSKPAANNNNNPPSGGSGPSGTLTTPPANTFLGSDVTYDVTTDSGNGEVTATTDANRSQYSGGAYTFTLSIDTNSTSGDFALRETISKQVASDVNQILFSIPPTRIIQADPIVEWDYNALPSGTTTVTYIVTHLADSSIDGNNFKAFFDSAPKTQIIAKNVSVTKVTPPDSCKILDCSDSDPCTVDTCNNGLCTHTDTNIAGCQTNYEAIPTAQPGNEMNDFVLIFIIIVIIFIATASGFIIFKYKKEGL